MKSLILTACILACTVGTASAQASAYFGTGMTGGGGPPIPGYTCAHTIAKGACIDSPQLRQQRPAKRVKSSSR